MRFAAINLFIFFAAVALGRWAFVPRSIEANAALVPAAVQTSADAPAADRTLDSSDARKTAQQRIEEALAGDDPLASAERVLAWIETATAEDLRALAAEPKKFLQPYFSGFDNEFRATYLEAIAARWFTLDPEGALLAIHHSSAGELLQAVARIRPELALEKLSLETNNNLDPVARTALQTLGSRDAKAARQFLDRFINANTRKAAEIAIAQGVAESDPLAAVALARQMNEDTVYQAALIAAERIDLSVVRQVLIAADGKLDRSVKFHPQWLLRYPDLASNIKDDNQTKAGSYVSEELRLAADRLPLEERTRLLAEYDSLPLGARDSLAAALASSWARSDPRAAAEWALAHAEAGDRASPANNAAQQVFVRWVNNDTDAALAWWHALPASPLRDALGNEASTFIAEAGDLDAALQLFHPSEANTGGGIRERFAHFSYTTDVRSTGNATDALITTQLAQFLAERDPAKAAAWLAALPAAVPTEQAAAAVIDRWYRREPESAARWIESLPPGARRD
ncbi:MAG TPA: hypothetical protein VFD27_21275, partial [Chthoniobacteraceae bacterium]|nr:hypothetical protein [Chthoniobacteraceae bacterium]